MSETVTITREQYVKLRRDSLFLEALNRGGVDNWDWHSEAYNEFLKMCKQEGLLSPDEIEEMNDDL